MKTMIFTCWTNLVEKFLHEIATKDYPYEKLSDWMDIEGADYFRKAQEAYFLHHKTEFVLDESKYLTAATNKLAYEQIAAGFDKIAAELRTSFPALKDSIDNKYILLKEQCFSSEYLAFIACRAVITAQRVEMENMNKNNIDKNPSNIFQFVMGSFQFLEQSARATTKSMVEYAAKYFPSQGITSASMFRTTQADESQKNENNPGISVVIKH